MKASGYGASTEFDGVLAVAAIGVVGYLLYNEFGGWVRDPVGEAAKSAVSGVVNTLSPFGEPFTEALDISACIAGGGTYDRIDRAGMYSSENFFADRVLSGRKDAKCYHKIVDNRHGSFDPLFKVPADMFVADSFVFKPVGALLEAAGVSDPLHVVFDNTGALLSTTGVELGRIVDGTLRVGSTSVFQVSKAISDGLGAMHDGARFTLAGVVHSMGGLANGVLGGVGEVLQSKRQVAPGMSKTKKQP